MAKRLKTGGRKAGTPNKATASRRLDAAMLRRLRACNEAIRANALPISGEAVVLLPPPAFVPPVIEAPVAFRRHCAACGALADLHEHHLVPRVHGGVALPTVMLCLACHGLVHGRDFSVNHRALTVAGMERARALGKKFGNPNPVGNANALRAGRAAQTSRAEARAAKVFPYISEARRCGAESLVEVAAFLTARGIRTPGGGVRWNGSQVWRIESNAAY